MSDNVFVKSDFQAALWIHFGIFGHLIHSIMHPDICDEYIWWQVGLFLLVEVLPSLVKKCLKWLNYMNCINCIHYIMRRLAPGQWMWIDNSVLDYTNWKQGILKSDTCVNVHSDTGKWSTSSCSRSRSYICKTPKGMFNQLLCTSRWAQQLLTLSIFFQLLNLQKSLHLLVSSSTCS